MNANIAPMVPKAPPSGEISPEDILNALNSAILVVDETGKIVHTNAAGEIFFKASALFLVEQRLDTLIPADSPLFPLIDQVRSDANPVSEYGVVLETPRIGKHLLNVRATPMPESPKHVVLALQERSIADKIDRQLTHRGAARSVSAMAAMMAHEVKNPLSGIRGAAQLLEENAAPDDRSLTNLIRDEVDRICGLVERMQAFDDPPLHRKAINIHKVLGRVLKLAENGFGAHLRFQEVYDPSLPPVYGNYDQLVQVFLNLVKNAAEAAPQKGGKIVLTTAYQHGVHFAVSSSASRVHLPLLVSVQDNGEGIPEDIKEHLFDPFVTSKPNGSGLGLALVAKIIDDHGGVIEFTGHPRRTVFQVSLPIAPEEGLQ
jgi:two-component system, NtrC family, nitrogen regulation sensor histidine kinase GlnL